MTVAFGRSRGFEGLMKDPRGDLRGFLFELALVISAPVDSMSGMTVNLVIVDGWMDEMVSEARTMAWNSRSEMLAAVLVKAAALIQGEAKIERIEIRHHEDVLVWTPEMWSLKRRESQWLDDEQGIPRETLVEKQLSFPAGREDEARWVMKESFSKTVSLPPGFSWLETRRSRGGDVRVEKPS